MLLLSVGVPESTPVVELKSSQPGVVFESDREIPCSVLKEKLPGCPTAQRERAGELITGACMLWGTPSLASGKVCSKRFVDTPEPVIETVIGSVLFGSDGVSSTK